MVVSGEHAMIRTVVAAALLTLGAIGLSAQTPAPELSKEMKSLQGTWVLVTADGQSVEGSGTEIDLSVTGDTYAQIANGQVVERGRIKLDASKTPIAIDLMIQEGDDANKTQLGVLQMGEGTITCKLGTPGATERPKDFAPSDGAFTFTAKKK
jgi:uncharacterized protein (TIGR03067 family)